VLSSLIQSLLAHIIASIVCFFFQEDDALRFLNVTVVQTCALPIFICAASTLPAAPYLLHLSKWSPICTNATSIVGIPTDSQQVFTCLAAVALARLKQRNCSVQSWEDWTLQYLKL